MASKPSTWPSLRIVTDSIPRSSASARAARRIRSRLRGARRSVFVAIDKAYVVRLSYAVSLRRTTGGRNGSGSNGTGDHQARGRAGAHDDGDRARQVRRGAPGAP